MDWNAAALPQHSMQAAIRKADCAGKALFLGICRTWFPAFHSACAESIKIDGGKDRKEFFI